MSMFSHGYVGCHFRGSQPDRPSGEAGVSLSRIGESELPPVVGESDLVSLLVTTASVNRL